MDLLLDGASDLKIENGDLALGDSNAQDIELILISNPGHWKQHPTVGVGLANWIKANMATGLLAKIQEELELDGFIEVSIEQDNLEFPSLIQASR